jgi:arginyl-tRNA synthetase
MTPEQLSAVVLAAAAAELADRGVDPAVLPVTATLERPRDPRHGDYASNLAMLLAAATGGQPRELAGALAARVAADPAVLEAAVAGPGFLNIRLTTAAIGSLAGVVVTAGEAYGRASSLAGQRVNLEFVSANPTGPLTLGSVRWAAVGDALARLLRAQGADVTTEYYFNDAGAQVGRFAASLLAAARGEPVPDDGYRGTYIGEIAAAIAARRPAAARQPGALRIFRDDGVALMFGEIKSSLADFGVHFDVYFSEQTLHDRDELAQAQARLEELGHTYLADGAVWVATSAFGDDKDRVLRRSDGSFSYFGADCAYYLDKRGRGFDRLMIILGADHHGYVGRLRAMAACFGDDPDETIEVLIGQMVNLVRGGQPVRLSKRAGDVITLADLVAAIGVDAARYALARYSIDAPIDIDLALWTRQGSDNPVFYVQYAHARICSLLASAASAGISRSSDYNPALLTHDREADLLKELGDFPAVVASAAQLRQPHRVARYLEQLAGSYHRFYDACRVLPRAEPLTGTDPAAAGDPAAAVDRAVAGDGAVAEDRAGGDPTTELTAARLWLVAATRVVLANGLGLLGVTAPERM